MLQILREYRHFGHFGRFEFPVSLIDCEEESNARGYRMLAAIRIFLEGNASPSCPVIPTSKPEYWRTKECTSDVSQRVRSPVREMIRLHSDRGTTNRFPYEWERRPV